MKVSWDWLADFVDLSGTSPAEVADGLTIAGLEVDEVRQIGGGIAGLVVARTTAIRPHPDADKLRLVTVDTGSAQVEVVCGARNVDAGQTIVFAPVGARLPGIKKLKAAKIRGVASEGMICSEAELELPATVDGIWVLPDDTPVGADPVRALGIADTVIVLDLTPNRPDALSVYGVAREVAARLGRPLRPYPAGAPWPTAETDSDSDDGAAVRVELADPVGCLRYTAQVIEGVTIGPAPWLIRRRLHACGVRAISNVVDVTNYVNLQRGQPLHAFDLDKLAGGRIVVRRARAGEELATLDGEQRKLHTGDLVIADAERPVALAGVMGGASSQVSEGATRLLLESAYFDPGVVRATARRHGLHTESSHRFERGIDPAMAADASAYAAKLIIDGAGGRLANRSTDAYPAPVQPRGIQVDCARVNRLLGTQIPAAHMQTLMASIDVPAEQDGGQLTVTAPTRRPDLLREVDVAEEVARLYGYDRIEAVLPAGRLHEPHRPRTLALPDGLPDREHPALRSDDDRRRIAGIRASLSATGFYEHLALPLVTEAEAPGVRLANSLGELTGLRTSLLPGLLTALHENARRGTEDVRLYELGKVFTPRDGDLPIETLRLGIALMGSTSAEWNAEPRGYDFYDLKGVLEAVLDALGVGGDTLVLLPDPAAGPLLHPSASAQVGFGEEPGSIGIIGELHPDARRSHDLPARTFVAELAVEGIPQHNRLAKCFSGLSRFPSVERDVALVLAEATLASDVLAALREVRAGKGGRLVEDARIFDVYRGAGIDQGSKSVAIKVRYRADRTLTDDEVGRAHGKLISALQQRLSAEIRDS